MLWAQNLFFRLETELKQSLIWDWFRRRRDLDGANAEFNQLSIPAEPREGWQAERTCALAKWWWAQDHHDGSWAWDGFGLQGGSGTTWENMKGVNRLIDNRVEEKYLVAGKSSLNSLLDAWLFSKGNAGSSCSWRYFELRGGQMLSDML